MSLTPREIIVYKATFPGGKSYIGITSKGLTNDKYKSYKTIKGFTFTYKEATDGE